MRACIPLQIQVILINHAHFWADQLNSCTHALFQRPLFQNYRCLNCNSSGILNKYLFFWCPVFCSDLNIGKLWKKKRFRRAPRKVQPCLHSYTQSVQPVSCCWSLCSRICVQCLAPVDLHENSNHEIITNDVTLLNANTSLFRLSTAILLFIIIISEWPPLDPCDMNICCSNRSRERRKLLSKSLWAPAVWVKLYAWTFDTLQMSLCVTMNKPVDKTYLFPPWLSRGELLFYVLCICATGFALTTRTIRRRCNVSCCSSKLLMSKACNFYHVELHIVLQG